MKYILMMQGTMADFEWYTKWGKEDLKAHFGFMTAFNKELKESGKLVATVGLASPTEAKRVRAGKRGEPVTDGVFPEAKEFLAGYWIVEVASEEEACGLAARISGAPHPARGEGSEENQGIEVRRVVGGPGERGSTNRTTGSQFCQSAWVSWRS